MLWAISTDPDGHKRLWVGLSETNVERLVNDQPIVKRLEGELDGWELVIMAGEDVARFCASTGLSLPPDMD